jgi:hypothetical protein
MKNAEQNNEKRHRTLIVIFLATTLFAFGVIFILSAAIAEEQRWGFLAIAALRDIGLLLATTGTISFLYELILRREIVDEIMERTESQTLWLRTHLSSEIVAQVATIVNPLTAYGVKNFHVNRDQLPKIPEQLGPARDEIFAVGLSLGSLVLDHRQLLEEKATCGCRVRLLMMNPRANGTPNPIIEKMAVNIDSPKYDTELNSRLETTKEWILRLRRAHPEIAAKIEARVYDYVPTLAILMVDAASEYGKVTVELYPFGRGAIDRPSIEFEFKGDSSLYRRIYTYYLRLWDNSKPLV